MAFTLVELLVVIAIIGVLAGLLLPVLGRAHGKASGAQCANNLSQLTKGWMLYTGDNDGRLINNWDGQNGSWVLGNMSIINNGDNGSNTNTQNFIDLEWVQTAGPSPRPSNVVLGAYLSKNPAVFKCPADKSKQASNGQARVRSVAMNQGVGNNVRAKWLPPNAGAGRVNLTYRRDSDMTEPSPSGLFVFVDEHPDSINDGGFAVRMSDPANPGGWGIIDFPANYHNNSSAFSFADGHTEIHKWVDTRTLQPITYTTELTGKFKNMPGNQDALWLSSHASATK